MATKLDPGKKVIRESPIRYRGRNLILGIEATEDNVYFLMKEKGRREWFKLDALTAYEVAMKLKAREART